MTTDTNVETGLSQLEARARDPLHPDVSLAVALAIADAATGRTTAMATLDKGLEKDRWGNNDSEGA